MGLLEDQYESTKMIFLEKPSKIIEDISKSSYPQTLKALFYCQKKIASLHDTIERLKSSDIEDVFYSVQTTTRALFEHFLVGHYIWTKARIEKNDTCGNEYYVHYRLSEILKRENYELGLEGIENKIKNNANFTNLKKRFSGYDKPIIQQDIDEIHRIAHQFDIKSIYNYVRNEVPAGDHFTEVHKILVQFLKEYNILSSFTHGGPSAEFEAFHNEPPIDKAQRIIDCTMYSKIILKTIRVDILMLLFLEFEEYAEILKPIMALKNA
jgi:hypothetical protein